MANQTENCCDGEVRTDPKSNYARRRRKRVNTLPYKIKDPIPEEIRDTDKLHEFFATYREILVPFASGNLYTSQSYLLFLKRLCHLSPTKGAILEAMKRYSFFKVDIVNKEDPVFDLGLELSEPTPSDKQNFYDFLKESIVWHGVDEMPCNLKQFAGHNSDDYGSTGNFYIELVHSQTLGVKQSFVYAHKAEHCLYVRTPKREQRFIAISPVWETEYVAKYKPDMIPLFPEYSEENGVRRTIIHVKNGNNTWYGRPKSQSSIRSQLAEAKLLEFFNKENASRFLAQLVIEYEEGEVNQFVEEEQAAMDEDHESLTEQFQKSYGADADEPAGAIIMARPAGAKAALVKEINSKTNETFYEKMLEVHENQICKSEGFPPEFLAKQKNTGLQTDSYLEQYKFHVLPKILENKVIEETHNLIINEVIKFQERQDLEGYGIMYKDLYFDTRKQLEEDDNNDNTALRGSEVQSSE